MLGYENAAAKISSDVFLLVDEGLRELIVESI